MEAFSPFRSGFLDLDPTDIRDQINLCQSQGRVKSCLVENHCFRYFTQDKGPRMRFAELKAISTLMGLCASELPSNSLCHKLERIQSGILMETVGVPGKEWSLCPGQRMASRFSSHTCRGRLSRCSPQEGLLSVHLQADIAH